MARSSIPHTDTLSGRSLSRVVRPTPQSPPRAQTPSPSRNPTRTRFLTPPTTPAVPRCSPTLGVTISRSTPQPQPSGDTVTPNEHAESSGYHPAPVVARPRREYYTNVYPLLRQEAMINYFKMDDGIANRPPEGEVGPFSLAVIVLIHPSCRCLRNFEVG